MIDVQTNRIGDLILTGILLALLAGCARIAGVVPAPPGPMPSSDGLLAGAAKVDLTPMPGFPMGGHSIGGTIARGYWTRLFARAIYLQDKRGARLVLVSCDLWAMPAGLADRVAEIVARQRERHRLGRPQIILAATHTHQSPGNYSSAKLYNDFAQRLSGFDPALFEFLAQRIASAIGLAFDHRRPATVDWIETTVSKLAWNRSFDAFAHNPERHQILAENANLPVPDDALRDRLVYHAVDARLKLLRMRAADDPDHATIAVAAFVAVHPTAMSPQTEVYTSDLFGVASTMAEHGLHAAATSIGPVVAIFNGAEGDISPDWRQQDRRDALRLGERLASKILLPMGKPIPLDLHIQHRYQIVRLAKSCYVSSSSTHEQTQVERCTADLPLAGSGSLGGAEDGRTVLYELGWQEGVRATQGRSSDHGAKQPALDPIFIPSRSLVSLTRLIVSKTDAPAEVPLGLYQLSPGFVLATLPGEFTVVMGRRINQALSRAFGSTSTHVALVGLANEYVSYFTTPEEYERQHYEGASTLYGPYSGPLIEAAYRWLATASSALDRYRFSYNPGPVKQYGLQDIGAAPYLPDAGLGNIAQELDTGLPVRDFPRLCWDDAVPEFPMPYAPRTRVTPGVAIQRLSTGGAWEPFRINGIAETDTGLNFITVVMEADSFTSTWCAIWMPPPEAATETRLRFRVQPLRNRDLCSPAFDLRTTDGLIGPGEHCEP